MKRKLLLGLGLLLSSTFVNAQWSTNYSWEYSFGTGTGTFNTVGTNSTSNSSTTGFLPAPASNGNVGVYLNSSAASGGFTLNGNNTLTEKLPTASFTRFSVNSVTAATDVVMNSFKIKFSDPITTTDAGSYTYAIGNHKGNLFNPASNSNVYRASNEVFTSLRWTPTSTANSTSIRFEYREGSDASSITSHITIDQTTFVKGQEYTVNIYCNNSSVDATYTVGTDPYVLPKNTFNIWVNGTKIGANFPRSIEVNGTTGLTSGSSIAFTNGTAINSFLFNATGAADASGSITLTDPKLTYLTPALPVSLTSFNGKATNNGVDLSWTTTSENNNDYFEILRSEDGINFQAIGTVKGSGNSQSTIAYSFIDNSPIKGQNYYQLKQVDYNASSKIMDKTLAIVFGADLSDFKVSSNENSLKIFSFVNQSGLTDFIITDLQGKTVAQSSRILTKGYNSFNMDLSTLKKGVYVAQMRSGDEYKIAKFIKE